MQLLFLNIKSSPLWLAISVLHVALICVLYYNFGLSTANEGTKYINEAQFLINGNLPQHFNYNGLFSTYVLYIAVFKGLHIPTVFIFISTYLISLYAYITFYKTLQQIILKQVAVIWLCTMLLSPLVLYWQLTLFSESFYIAMSLLFISFLFKTNYRYKIFILSALALILMFTRPSGFFTVLVFGLFYFYHQKKINLKLSLVIGLSFLLILFCIVFFYLPITYDDFTLEITSGAVYCGFHTLPASSIPYGKYTLWHCYQFLYQHYGFNEIILLIFTKWVSFFNLNRPYYSQTHNLINALHYIFYFLALFGIVLVWKLNLKMIIALIILIILNSLLIAITYNEWSERHTVEVFPYVYVLAALGLKSIFETIKLKLIQIR